LKKLPFNCIGQVDLSELGLTESESSYSIAFYEFSLYGAKTIILCGENSFTSKYLDDESVYNPDTFKGKLCLYSIGIRCYIEYMIDNERNNLPDLIHLHDYHVVIPFISLKQQLYKHGLDVASLITIHLLTYPKENLGFYKACGIDDTPIKVLTEKGIEALTIDEIFNRCRTRLTDGSLELPTLEKIGAYVGDLVTTVSESYLKSDIIPNLGGDSIEFKTDFLWDGCDWEYDKIKENVLNDVGNDIRNYLGKEENEEISRTDIKHYLLTHKIGNLDRSPIIKSEKVLRILNEIANGNQFVKNGRIKSFESPGPLLITTGRISRQKGFDLILHAIPRIIEVIPNAKFLFLILPTEYSLEEIRKYSKLVKKYPDNLRIIFGVATDIFHMAHLSADVYAALSRWEPFGIMALEAMAVRLPIIATKVGGLQETVIDVRKIPEYGTGVLIEKDNIEELIEASISLLIAAEVDEKTRKTGSIYSDPTILNQINQIPDQVLKSRILLDGEYYDKVRENARNRVKYNFRWEIVSKKLIELYDKIQEMHPIS
ncbi:MAG: glycosyltransferase, partial [Promethearchaeota archaeon]